MLRHLLLCASLVFPDGHGGQTRITGVTLPVTPAVAVGSNSHVAWGFTNSYIDTSDAVALEPVPGRPDHYATPQGPQPIRRVVERLVR